MRAIAVLNKKSQPMELFIGGDLVTPNERDLVRLEMATSQGFNPTILILTVVIDEAQGPKKGTDKSFFYYSNENVSEYKQIKIENEDDSILIPVIAYE